MQYRNTTPKRLLTALTAGSFLLSACWQDPSSSGGEGGSATATLEGRVSGDMALGKRSAAGIEGATVIVVRLKADGSFETVSESAARTDAEGRFTVETAVEASHGLLVVAKKEAREFKAVVSGEVKKGAKTFCRPLDVESSVEAEVYARTRAGGKAVSFADIAAYVDGDVAARVMAEAEAETEATAFLAAQLETEAEVREAVLTRAGRIARARLEAMETARLEAQASLEAALHAAAEAEGGLAAGARAEAESLHAKAELQAVAGAGIALGEFAMAREAALRAMLKAHGQAAVDSGTRQAWLRRIALKSALFLEAALEADVEVAGGDFSLVAAAGAALEASLRAARTEAEVDSAFARCRRAVASGMRISLEGNLGGSIGLGDSSRSAFALSLESATTAEAVAEAHARFYAAAEAEIEARLESAALEASRLQALVRAAVLVQLQGSAGSAGFSLSGSVEGGLSGAEVRLARVQADGDLEILSDVKAATDAGGGFILHVDKPVPSESLVVVVTKDTARFSALVDAGTDPIRVGAESTVETEMFRKMLEGGQVDVTPAEVKARVDSVLAVSLRGDDSLLVSLIATLEAAAGAQARFLADSGVGLSQAGLLLIAGVRAGAQAKLEADLKAAAGEASRIEAAYDVYHEAILAAYLEAGLDATVYAHSMQVHAQATVNSSANLAAEARTALLRSAHGQAARGLRSAVEIHMKAAGASEAMLKTVVAAGVTLQAALDAASRSETVESAYASYHAAVTASLKGVLLLHAEAIGSADSRIRREGGARAELMAAVKGATTSDGYARAHLEFAAEVEAEVKAAVPGGAGAPSAAQIQSIGQVLLLANMCG